MQTPKSDQDLPVSAREAAFKRRMLDMSEVLRMRQLPPIRFETGDKPQQPEPKLSQ